MERSMLGIVGKMVVVVVLCLSGVAFGGTRPVLDVNAMIRLAKDQGETILRIPPGSYDIDRTIMLDNMKDLTIDGTGVTLYMTALEHTFLISNSDGITLKGLTLDYDPIPFTQGTIAAIEGDEISFDIHAGYPDLTTKNLYDCLYVFDRATRLWKKGVGDVYGKMSIVDPRSGVLVARDPQPMLEVGDFVAVDKRHRSSIFASNGTKNLSFEDITILSAPGATIGGRFCGPNFSFKRVKVTRGPKPAGATEDRLLSTNADAINIALSTSAPRIEDCEFGFMGDDAVNFHGPLFPIIKVESSTSFLTVRINKVRPYKDIMVPGTELRHLAKGTYAKLGVARFASIDQVKKHEFEDAFLKRTLPRWQRDAKDCTVYRITTQGPVSATVGQNFDYPSASCSGFSITNSYFHDNRPRGLRLMSSNGVIEGNRFERIQGSAICIGNEYPDWGEAGWVENVQIRNNTIVGVGTGGIYSEHNKVPGAICVFTMNSEGMTDYFPGHQDITIENNTIVDSAPVGIYIYGTGSGLIQGNRIVNSLSPRSREAGSSRGLSPSKAIDVHDKSSITLINNTIEPSAN